MRLLKNYMAFLAITLLLFSSCTKDETAEVNRDVSSDVATLYLGPLLGEFESQNRQQEQDIPACSTEDPAFAQIKLTYGESNTPVEVIVAILMDDQGLFTAYDEALEIPIPSGETTVSVTLTDFVVWTDDGGAPGTVIWVAPKMGSEYAKFVSDPLSNVFSLRAGSKNYVNVDVICYDDRDVNLYGYQFFDINPVPLYEFCVFANYCNDAGRHYTADYDLSLYTYSGEGEEENPMENAELYTSLYTNESPNTGNDEGTYFADPLCLAIPGPKEGQGPDDPYLYYEISLSSWEPYYTPDEAIVKSGYLTWSQIADLLDVEGDEAGSTVDYWHIFFNCGDDDGPVECDPDDPEADCDEDGILNGDDNCPEISNKDQADLDDDGVGDVCDPDIDGDGTDNELDPCPEDPTDACADDCAESGGDSDGDGICDDIDNCVDMANPDQADLDDDGVGDVCDPDIDGDGTDNELDPCPEDPTDSCVDECAALGGDSDGDGICDDNDNCVDMANPDQADLDDDGVGDVCDPDIDGDGTDNELDPCPEDPTDGCVPPTCEIGAADTNCSKYYLSGSNGFVEIIAPAGEFPDLYGLIPEGGVFEDRIGSCTVQLGDDLNPVVTIILNEGFSVDDYIIEVRDESGSEITCVAETSVAAPVGDDPDIFENFTDTADYDYSFFVRIEVNACPE